MYNMETFPPAYFWQEGFRNSDNSKLIYVHLVYILIHRCQLGITDEVQRSIVNKTPQSYRNSVLVKKCSLKMAAATAIKILHITNKAFTDIRLRPGIATPLATHRHTAHYGQT